MTFLTLHPNDNDGREILLNIEQILSIEDEGGPSKITLIDGKEYLVDETLGTIQDAIRSRGFLVET